MCSRRHTRSSEYTHLVTEANSAEKASIIGISFLFRAYNFQDDAEVRCVASEIAKLKRSLGQRRNSQRRLQNDISVPAPLAGLLDHIHCEGLWSRRYLDAWTPMTRNYSTEAAGSLLKPIAGTLVGRRWLCEELDQLTDPSGRVLLQHPGVASRLLGMALELGGRWEPQYRRVILFGRMLGPLCTVVGPGGQIALQFLGDVSVRVCLRKILENRLPRWPLTTPILLLWEHLILPPSTIATPLNSREGEPTCLLRSTRTVGDAS